MWRTFYVEYDDSSDFDDFLNRIEAAGYNPVFVREAYRFKFVGGQRKTIVEALVTSRKKDA